MTVTSEMIDAGKACFVAALDDPGHAGDGRVFAEAYNAMKALDPDLPRRLGGARRDEADKLLPFFMADWEPLRSVALRSGMGKSASQLSSCARDLLARGLIEARWAGSSMREYRARDGGDTV
jgi:hypothetical protein